MAENESVFVEQAEYLDSAMFSTWFVEHPKEVEILRKLKASGAKLLIGPRGTGKTTLMLKAMDEMLFAGQADALPVYVNFKTSLRLEPLYKSTGNATFWFNQWLFLNSALGIVQSFEKLGLTGHSSAIGSITTENARKIVDALQSGDIDTATKHLGEPVTNSQFSEFISDSLEICERSRVVFLFDDAAHAFSADQQRDFFDFFRLIKSSTVSPKAAIYPGVTNFSSAFHVGHDAEEVNIWLDPAEPRYLKFMLSLVQRRLSGPMAAALTSDDATFQLLALSAFGIPRNMLNMVRKITTADEESETTSTRRKTFSRTAALGAIAECADTSQQIFKSLKAKLPTYASFVDQGMLFLRQAVQTVKEYNGKTSKGKTVTIAIAEPLASELKTLLAFLEYSGLVRPRGNVSRGVKGTFSLFDVHYALLIEANAVLAQKAFTVADVAENLAKRDAHAFARTTPEKLLGTTNIAAVLPLQLPPCEVCSAPRASPEAKFCMNCGSPLSLKSTFETAVQQSISLLPLTANRVQSIKGQSSIRTIKDVLLDKEHKELLKVKMIGPIWATRISRYAEEFVE